MLFLSFRSSDEDGDPVQPSPFVDDVRALFTDELWRERGTRLLAEVTWPPATAPTPHELSRALAASEARPEPPALAPPESEAVHAMLAARGPEPARALETFAACGVRWLVEALLRPARVEPDPEPMRRGSLAHAVLERTLRRLRERTGSARLAPETLPAALAELDAAIGELRAERGREGATARGRAALRALEEDLSSYLRHEAECGAGLEPQWLEWSFGGERDDHAPLPLNGSGLAVTGRVDRIDVDAVGPGAGARLQGPPGGGGRALGAGRQAPGGAVRARRARAARARARRRPVPADRPQRRPPARARPRRDARPLRERRRGGARGARRGARRGAGARGPDGARDALGRHPAVPVALLPERLRVPGHLPRRGDGRAERAAAAPAGRA